MKTLILLIVLLACLSATAAVQQPTLYTNRYHGIFTGEASGLTNLNASGVAPGGTMAPQSSIASTNITVGDPADFSGSITVNGTMTILNSIFSQQATFKGFNTGRSYIADEIAGNRLEFQNSTMFGFGAVLTNLTSSTIGVLTNAFAGPTNVLNLANGGDQYYRSVTSCSFTGITGKASSPVAQYVLLSVYNSSATNITFTLPASVMTRDGLRSYTITNATMGFLSVRYGNYFTNAVFSQSL